MHEVSTVYFPSYKIDLRPLTVYWKGILHWKKKVLMFMIASHEGSFVELTSACSKLKTLITSLLVRSWEINSFGNQGYTFCPLGK
jgi:hypothetical protein